MQTKDIKTTHDHRSITSLQKKDAITSQPAEHTNQVQDSWITMQRKKLDSIFGSAIQRQEPEADDLLQGKFVYQLQKDEEEEPLQGKFLSQLQTEEEEEPIQGKFVSQLSEEDEKEPMQGKFPIQQKQNNTGMPDEVKSRMETSMNSNFSDVRVHPESSHATDVGALAYAQGSDVHFAPGQFKPDTSAGLQLIGHELAHVVQQKEGRVEPTTEVSGMPVNDDQSLEQEADAMGARAAE